MAGEVARRYDITIAIEPLRRQESNILNTGAEALEMVRRVKHTNVRMIIDYFHLAKRTKTRGSSKKQSGKSYICTSPIRRGGSGPMLSPKTITTALSFAALKKTGYSGGISIEGQGFV